MVYSNCHDLSNFCLFSFVEDSLRAICWKRAFLLAFHFRCFILDAFLSASDPFLYDVLGTMRGWVLDHCLFLSTFSMCLFKIYKSGYCIILFCTQSKKISNDQELIQSDPTSCPQNQKGNNLIHKLTATVYERHSW